MIKGQIIVFSPQAERAIFPSIHPTENEDFLIFQDFFKTYYHVQAADLFANVPKTVASYVEAYFAHLSKKHESFLEKHPQLKEPASKIEFQTGVIEDNKSFESAGLSNFKQRHYEVLLYEVPKLIHRWVNYLLEENVLKDADLSLQTQETKDIIFPYISAL